MIELHKTQNQCKNRKEYLVRAAIEYIISHTGYIGIDDGIIYDDAQCDGYALANDLADEFGIEDLNI